jgi:hypothetical protein
MNPLLPSSRFDLSLATPQGRRAWGIAAILFGGALILDLATGRGEHAPGLSRVEPQVIKPHAVEPYADRRITLNRSTFAPSRPGGAEWGAAEMAESRLGLARARSAQARGV